MSVSTAQVSQIGPVIAKALRDRTLLSKLLTEPKQTLLDMNVPIPPEQAVTILESDEHRSFFVLPIMTDAEVQTLKNSLDSIHPNRLVRSRVLIKAMEDPAYKIRLFQEPKAVLKEEGMTIPDAVHLTVLENSAEHLYIVIPAVHHHSH
ncbi:MAG TPA: NHLP leader peptide family RiPP precursor [Crinalium sp.]|jgi:hypothetical protein